MTKTAIKIAIAGGGGVGGALAALLARAGFPVSLLARGLHGQALRTRGLRFAGTLGDFTTSLAAVSDRGDELGPADFLLVAVKTFQLAEALPQLRAMTGPHTVVVPLLNGVTAAERLAAELDRHRVAAGIIYINSWIAAPGVIAQLGPTARVVVGERAGRGDLGDPSRLLPLGAALTAAGITAEVVADLPLRSWEKFLGFEPMALVGALSRSPIGAFRAEPAPRALLVGLMEEVAALARRRGVPLAEDAVARRLAIIDGLAPDATISLQRDLMAGRVSELEEQCADLLAMARSLDVPMPLHQLTVPLLQLQERAARGAAR